MTPIHIDYRLDPAVARAAYVLASQRLGRAVGRRPLPFLAQFLMGGGIGLLAVLALQQQGHAAFAAGLGALALFMGGNYFFRRFLFGYLADQLVASCGPCRLSLDEAGLCNSSAAGEVRYPWSQVLDVSEQKGWLAIVVGAAQQVLPLPEAALAPGQREEVLAALRQGMAQSRSAESPVASAPGAGGPVPGVDPEAEAGPTDPASPRALPATSLKDDLAQLGRLLTLRAPLPGSLAADVGKLPMPILLFALLTLGLQVLAAGFPGELLGYEASQLLSPFAGVALAAALAVLAGGARGQGGRLWLALTLVLILLPLANWWTASGAGDLADWLNLEDEGIGFVGLVLVYYLPQLWLILVGARAAWLLAGATRARAWVAAGVATLVLGATFWQHLEAPTLWYATGVADNRPRLQIDENVLYGQPRLLERHLATVQPGRPGVPEVFFLGVGGYGEQDVFLREVRSVQQLFDERYGTAGHSLLLANNPATVQELPVANAESLQRALARLGAQMNGEEDLLFLFLTSHGSRNHRFSLSFWPFQFNDISPETLRRALDDAGIKRRVVVVSACYSGGFIPALQDERTLVITASAADRNSFGCSDGNDFTDFGRAYFNQALRETRSFTHAFELASAQVAEWEKTDGLKPSLPQMQGGAALHEQLQALAYSSSPTPASDSQAPLPPAYQRLARALLPEGDGRRYREICLEAMGENSPLRMLARDPQVFNGLERDPRHWPLYMAAWERFAGEYCETANDLEQVSALWARAWQRALPPAEAERLAAWLETPAAQAFRQAYRAAALEESRLAARHSLDVQRQAERHLVRAGQEIRAAYARDAAANQGQQQGQQQAM